MSSIVRMMVLLSAAGAALAASPAARAGDTPPDTARSTLVLHLDDALALAQRASWDLQSARTQVAIARAGLRTARERANPTVSLSTTRIHTDPLGDATALGNGFWERAYDSVGQLSQLVEIGGKRPARRASAAAALDGADARVADEWRTLEADVVRAYVGAALAEADTRIARESAGYLADEARIADIRLQAGDISRSDRDQIAIAASRLALDAESAAAQARAQRIALEMLIGVPHPDGDVVVADSLETLAERLAAPPPAPAPGERADLVAARADLRRAESDLRLQRAERVPDPTLFVQLERTPPDRPNTVGAGVSFPLPLWNRNGGAIAAARAARDDAARTVRRVEAQVASDVAGARAVESEAVARWRRYRDELRPRSEEIRRTVSLAYERGGASLLDLLEAQRSDNDVRLATMQAASDAVTAAATLRAATAAVTPESTRP